MISRLSIAPMIDWTDRHFRVFMRFLLPRALLYTEMQVPQAIFNAPHRSLLHEEIERPLALQLGGSDPKMLIDAALLGESHLFSEINLNVGCPSSRVQAGRFGACLMKEPSLVASLVAKMKAQVSIPVTVKTRIGVDELDDYAYFESFVEQLVAAEVDGLIVHARKAWLKGLSPLQNRTIPPLKYDWVYQIKERFPNLPVILNGGIVDLESVLAHLSYVDGVMIGRLALNEPYRVALIHHHLYPETVLLKRSDVFLQYQRYLLKEHENGIPLTILLKPIFNLASGFPYAKRYKKFLMETIRSKNLSYLDDARQYLYGMEEGAHRNSPEFLVN